MRLEFYTVPLEGARNIRCQSAIVKRPENTNLRRSKEWGTSKTDLTDKIGKARDLSVLGAIRLALKL
jgi:hypothetical protein